MPERWQRLHLANDGDIPPLLYQYSLASSGYELYMTDLNYIWSEHLDRRAILKRAEKDNTPIDPSEDLDQFKVLLSKIQEGLQNGADSNVSLNPNTGGSAHTLELTVTSKLPAPLEPLVWKMFLSKEARSSATRHLLLPLINAEAEQEARQRSLIEELNKKDWVLAKLLDKFETLGIDLSTIFPGASGLRAGRKGVTLTEMGKYIKGLAPFDEESWREEISKSSLDSALTANIIAELSHGSRNPTQLYSLEPPPDGWWEDLIVSNNTTSSTSPEDNNKPTTHPAADSLETDTDAGSEIEDGDDEFERQETPPRLRKPGKSSRKSLLTGKDEAGESRLEDEATSPKNKLEKATEDIAGDHPTPAKRLKAPLTGRSKGLGTIGGKKQTKQKSPSPSPTPTPTPSPSPPHRKHEPLESLTDEETRDDDADVEPQRTTPNTITQKHTPKAAPRPGPKPSRRLGIIGGKKEKQPTPEPEPRPETETDPEPSNKPSQSHFPEPHPPPKKKKPLGKIGVIGGHKSKQKASQNSSFEAPNTSRKESVPPPAKTNEENCNTDDEEEGKHGGPSGAPPPPKAKIHKRGTPAEPEREETEEEKADRKREELKRQLEAKSKVPAKKKRRF
ncbi:XRCC4-like factor-domain-containing protein [Aspergillus navahoensis]